MQTDYSAPDIDTTQAQRQAAEAQESFVNFTSIRQTLGSADASFAFGTRATRPASGLLGDRYYASDIGSVGGWLYYWNGTAWEIVVGWASGSNAVRAAITVSAVDNGAWFYATDTSKFWEVSGGVWVDRTPPSAAITEAFVTIGNTASLSGERALTGTATQITITDNGAGSAVVISLPATVNLATALQIAGVQVIGTRKNGWTIPTGTPSRVGFDTATATLTQLAETLKALIDDLHQTAGHGAIGT